MEHTLTCNNLRCRAELRDRALVTTCSHIFCQDCAQSLGEVGTRNARSTVCPACNSQLTNPDDAVMTSLNPSEDYKTRILSGLSPNIIMECAGRALSFWAYQTTQDILYQQYLYKTLGEKYSNLNMRLDKTVHDANTEIDNLQNKLANLAVEKDTLRRKNEELAHAYREKTKKLLQTQELYDKVKRKAEMGNLQRAASDAVDSSTFTSMADQPTLRDGGFGTDQSGATSRMFGGGHRFDANSMNTAMPRAGFAQSADHQPWNRMGIVGSVASSVEERQDDILQPFRSMPLGRGPSRSPASRPGNTMRRAQDPNVPNFANGRGGLAGLGLVSGLKVSQPQRGVGLNASIPVHEMNR